MVYRTVEHRGQWPKSSTPLVLDRSKFLPSHGRPQPLSPWVRLLPQTPGHSSETACPGDPAGPASGVRTVWSLVWAAPCLDHAEPHFLPSLSWNVESLGRNRAQVASSTQCSELGKDKRYLGCPTARKPAREIERARAGSGRQH